MEVWDNEKLKWEHKPTGRVFPCHFNFSQTFTITYGNTGKNEFYFFYKITQRKLERGKNILMPDLLAFAMSGMHHSSATVAVCFSFFAGIVSTV